MPGISGLQKLEVRFGSCIIGSFCGRGIEVWEQLRKRKVEMSCLQEVRWRGQGAEFFAKGSRHKLWWCGSNDGI